MSVTKIVLAKPLPALGNSGFCTRPTLLPWPIPVKDSSRRSPGPSSPSRVWINTLSSL